MSFQKESKNVVLLEDQPRYIRMLSNIVLSLGYTPIHSENRQDFLELVSKTNYFAFILDNLVPYDKEHKNPKPNIGLSLSRYFLKTEPGLKVALHTSDEKNADIERHITRGLVYIKKPASIEEITKFLS